MTTMSGLDLGKRLQQQVAAAWPCRRRRSALPSSVGQSGKSLVGGRDRRQLRRCRCPGPGKPGTGVPPVTTVTAKPSSASAAGDPAGAREMADAEQMLDIEEDARARSSAACHSCSNRPSAGGCWCGGRNAARTCRSAASPSRLRSAGSRIARSSAAASACGSSGGTTSPFSPSTSSSGTPEILVETQARLLARRLDQHVGQAVAVAVGGDPAGQREDVGLPVAVEHLRPAPARLSSRY